MSAAPQQAELPPWLILCVDDEPKILEALALTLGRRYRIEMAASGPAALDMLRTLPETAVIISDMRMPQMDGAQFLAASRALAPDARRILLTGHANMASAVAAVNDGKIFKYLTKPCSFADLVAAVEEAIADHQKSRSEFGEMRRQAWAQDRATGLATRMRLEEQIADAQAREIEAGAPGHAILMMEIVDQAGLLDEGATGRTDFILQSVADRLRSAFPQAESIARCDTRTFAVMVEVASAQQQVLELLGLQCVDVFARPFDCETGAADLRACVGIAVVNPEDAPDAALRHSLMALQGAKLRNDGINVFVPETGARAEQRRGLVNALRIAIAQEQIVLHYQPIIDLRTGGLYSLEALARWQHPSLGSIPPATFIPLAEQVGLMVPLGEAVLRRGCQEARGFLELGCPRVSINVSITQIVDVGFMNSIFLALETSGLDPCALELEITESVFAQDNERVCALLKDVRAWGISASIDDFGVGYSSLSQLSHLPVNQFKTDSIFVRDFDHGGEAIIDAALALGRKLGIETVIEGVEDPAMLARLRLLGASRVQGFLFARPMPVAETNLWLAELQANGGRVADASLN